jgi:hypothetical protein
VLIKEQAIYTSGLSSTPISLDLAKVIKILRFFGLKDKEFGRWMLLQLVQISNIIFTAQIEVANATNSQG